MTSHWLYKGEPLNDPPDNAFGFIYQITNVQTGRKYIGRKYFGKTRRVKQKGKTRRKVVRTESDWKTYTGSSKTLTADIQKLGKDMFTFEILLLGYTKGQVNYLEENVQHSLQVVMSDQYYNDCVGSRKWLSVKFTDEQLSELLSYLKQM